MPFLPPREAMLSMPQRPCLPLGRPRGAATYPAGPEGSPADAVEAAPRRVGLGELVPMPDLEEGRWDRALSVGRQRRLAFARLLLHRPRWVFLDEATAALDEANQEAVMSILGRGLPEAAVVSIGHRPGLERFHRRALELAPSPSGARLRLKPSPADGDRPPLGELPATVLPRRPPSRPPLDRTRSPA
jgi:vitamin B12/bleomycin/antimicrobial peptide transport system ATP-binding/permease protein